MEERVKARVALETSLIVGNKTEHEIALRVAAEVLPPCALQGLLGYGLLGR